MRRRGLETGFGEKEGRRSAMAKAMYKRKGQEVESKEGSKLNVEGGKCLLSFFLSFSYLFSLFYCHSFTATFFNYDLHFVSRGDGLFLYLSSHLTI